MAKHKPYTLGVTGGIGSGKTTVCRIFEKLGAQIFYADDEAKKIMTTDKEVKSEIVKAFGEACYNPGGTLNSNTLARKVFQNAEATERINSIVHPRVFKAFDEVKKRAVRENTSLLIKEAALIYESGSHRQLDGTLVVTADEETRIRRTMSAKGWTRDEVASRMDRQFPQEKLKELADYTLENSGTVEELEKQVLALYSAISEGKSNP